MLLPQFRDRFADPLLGFGHNGHAAHPAFWIISVGKRTLRVGVDQRRLVPDAEPVCRQAATEAGFPDPALGRGQSDHSEHRIAS